MYVLTLRGPFGKPLKKIRFHVKACAEIFQQSMGGTLSLE